MSNLWPTLESDSNSSIFDSLYVPENDITYDSDVSSNEYNFSNSSFNNTVPEPSLFDTVIPSTLNNLVESLHPEKIRWFYKESKLWIPFCGYDSLRLETKYLELSNQIEMSDESMKEKIVVRGDLFEVDVLKRIGFPIYWNAVDEGQESFPILRGTWFRESSWQPLDSESIAIEIEKEHIKFYGSNHTVETDGFAQNLSQKLNLSVKSMVIGEYHIDWYDQDTIFMYTDSASHFIRQKLGLTKVGSKLKRGYKSCSRIEDKLPDITHLVFVIHGIGQKMKGGDITFQVSRIRTVCRRVVKKFFPLLEESNQRVEFLPVEWRKSLILDGNTVELITPNRNKGLRNALNSTALDILYYSSPIYRPEMIGSLRSELNRLYSMFCSRSPYFESKGGKISVIAHSLGAVILYDILTDWSPAKIYEYLETLDIDNKDKSDHDHRMEMFSELRTAKEKVRHLELMVLTKAEQENSKRGQTNFRTANFPINFINGKLWKVLPKLENFFCVGSPLSVFLALRGLKPQNATSLDHILPSDLCRRMFNIFHPADPVVYRIEPLVNKQYVNIEPVRIYRLDHPNKAPYDEINNDLLRSQNYSMIAEESLANKKVLESQLSSSTPDAAVSMFSQNSFTFAGRIMKIINRFKVNTAGRFTNKVLSTVASSNDMDLFSDKSDSIKLKKRENKMKSKIIFRGLDLQKNMHHIRSISQSELNISPEEAYKLKRPSWIDLSGFKQLKNRRRLSEFQCKRNIEYSIINSNWNMNPKVNSKLYVKYSSDEETLKSSNSSIKSLERNMENNLEDLSQESEMTSPNSLENKLKFRIDFKLPESRYENSYLSVLTSHTCYWNSPELCMFMLTQIFGHLGPIGSPL